MGNNIIFGKLLELLLNARGWSAAKLAKELNVDASYTRKWIRGERVPSLQTDYVKEIATALTSGLISDKENSIEKVFVGTLNGIGLEVKQDLKLSELILECLTNAQVYSLSLSSELRKNKINPRHDEVAQLVELSSQKHNVFISRPSDFNIVGVLSDIPLVIKGRKNILNAAISVINTAIERKNIEKVDILLTFQGERDIFQDDDNINTQFDFCIHNALENGLDVFHIFRLNKNISRSFKIIEKILNFKGNEGNYKTFYFDKYGIINFPIELIIAPGVGALVLFTNNGQSADTAFFYSQWDAVEALKKYYNLLLTDTSSLVEVYSEEENFNYRTETDKRKGTYFSIQNEFESLACPYSLWEKFLNRTLDNTDEINQHLTRINSRLQSFHEQVERYSFGSIISKKSIEQMINTGAYNRYSKYRRSTPEDIVEHLENVILLLKKYDNYRIALLSEELEKVASKTLWTVKGDYYVVLERNSFQLKDQAIAFIVKETTIANAFKEYFIDIWDRIPEINKDKEYIIPWLEEQIEILKSRLEL